MFLETEWYWWLVTAAVLAVSIPVKIKFMNWLGRRQQKKKDSQRGKRGDDE